MKRKKKRGCIDVSFRKKEETRIMMNAREKKRAKVEKWLEKVMGIIRRIGYREFDNVGYKKRIKNMKDTCKDTILKELLFYVGKWARETGMLE